MAKRKKRLRRKTSELDENNPKETVDGDEGLLWVQEVQVRPRSERKPMARITRWKKKLFGKRKESVDSINGVGSPDTKASSSVSESSRKEQPEEQPVDGADENDERRQFTVTSIKKERTLTQRLNAYASQSDFDSEGYSPSKLFVAYINWTFRASFLTVFASFLAIFFIITFSFGGFLRIAGDRQPGCIVVSGEQFGYNPDTTLADAFALSWTTFTTVGYGMIYTSTGTDYDDQKDCTAIVFLCTAESFIGLLYAGMCAAILFGKIGRIQSHAQVSFSHAICIQYGAEEKRPKNTVKRTISDPIEEDEEAETPQAPEEEERIRCPVLKFQIINQLSNKPGGEIMDAMLKVLVANKSTDSSAAVASYVKLDLKEFEHPFFNRVWHGRHVMNASSPLLSSEVKALIRRNNGYWPASYNDADGVREALAFTDFIVTIVGISNVSASTVHAYKTYKKEDVLVGYDFAPLLYKHSDTDRLKVDLTLINDVVEQRGGGAEEVQNEVDSFSMNSMHSFRMSSSSSKSFSSKSIPRSTTM